MKPKCTVLVVSNFSNWEHSNPWKMKEDDPVEVVYRASGQEGLAWAEQNPPDLILYYLWTLDLNGYQFCEQARIIPALHDVPIVLVGVMRPEQVRPQAERCGAAGYITLFQSLSLVEICEDVSTGAPYYPQQSDDFPPADSLPGEGMKVLIIDDSPELAGLLTLILGWQRNDRVLYLPNSLEGVTAAEQLWPDLIILDTMMPNMDGWPLCELLKTHPDLKHVPILMSSSISREIGYPEAQGVGADGYISQPFVSPEIVAARDELLRGGQHFPTPKEMKQQGW